MHKITIRQKYATLLSYAPGAGSRGMRFGSWQQKQMHRLNMLILLNLLAGVALLVWGSHIVRTGILRVLGADLRSVLGRSTRSRWRAFLAGVGVTSLVQSSNATAVIVTSFAAQGLLPLTSGLAIMLGADVGTALMARVLTLDLSWLSPILILVGVPLFLSRKQSRLGQTGRTLIGLGLILLALHLIVKPRSR